MLSARGRNHLTRIKVVRENNDTMRWRTEQPPTVSTVSTLHVLVASDSTPLVVHAIVYPRVPKSLTQTDPARDQRHTEHVTGGDYAALEHTSFRSWSRLPVAGLPSYKRSSE